MSCQGFKRKEKQVEFVDNMQRAQYRETSIKYSLEA